jgi:hypothetical protein
MLRADGVWALTARRGAPAHVLLHAWRGLDYALRAMTPPLTDICAIWNLPVVYNYVQPDGRPFRCYRSMRIDRITGSPDPCLWKISGHELRADNVIKQRQSLAFLMGTKDADSSVHQVLVTASSFDRCLLGLIFEFI